MGVHTNWWKCSLLTAAVIGSWYGCGSSTALGQEIHLKSRNVYTGPGSSDARPRYSPRASEAGPVHQIIQFDHFPGSADLSALLVAGFKVVSVVPDNAVVVISPKAVELQDFAAAQVIGVRWLGELEAGDKLSPALETSDSTTLAIVEFHADVGPDIQQAIVRGERLTFERPAALL